LCPYEGVLPAVAKFSSRCSADTVVRVLLVRESRRVEPVDRVKLLRSEEARRDDHQVAASLHDRGADGT
jgi:hypothetical protein